MDSKNLQFKINKNTGSKKVSWVKLCLAGAGLFILILSGKNFFAPAPATLAVNPHANNTPAVLGAQISQNLAQSNTAASSTPPAPLPQASAVAAARPAASASAPPQKKVEIKNTPTGYLNVRSQPSLSSPIIAKVRPGEAYSYTATNNGWYKISLQPKGSGWIDGEYTDDNNSDNE